MMNTSKLSCRFALFLGIVCSLLAMPVAIAADSDPAPTPAIIQNGFKTWAEHDASYATDLWKKDGLLDGDSKPDKIAAYFKKLGNATGNFKSYDVIQSKRISENSQAIYVAISFERAAVYGRFLVFNGTKGWVVQNMDFSTKPEAVMPWLAFSGEDYSQ